MGLFIVFEGIDGAGKTSQIPMLHKNLVNMGYDPLLTHEPGGTPIGDTVAEWLKKHTERSPLTELLLMCTARAEHTSKVIKPALDERRIVICDRYSPSTMAYQGYGRGLELELIQEVNIRATGGIEPDLIVLLDIPISTAYRRKPNRKNDGFETEKMEFHQRTRNGYLSLASENPTKWLTIDGTLPKSKIAAKILDRVSLMLTKLT